MTLRRGFGGYALSCLIFASAAMAQEITLSSRDGGASVTGQFLSFDGEFYRIDTEYGPLTIDGTGVNCDGSACPNLIDFVAKLRIAGAAPVAETVIPVLIASFSETHGFDLETQVVSSGRTVFSLVDGETGAPAAIITVDASTSTAGIEALLNNDADIALATREVTKAERARAEDPSGIYSGLGPEMIVALDGLVPVVSPFNPVSSIRILDMSRLYKGEIANWQELGGVDAPIYLHGRSAGTDIAAVMSDKVLSLDTSIVAENMMLHDSDAEVAAAVIEDPFAIGFTTLAAKGDAKALHLTSDCGYLSSATPRNLKSEDYPLTMPAFFYVRRQRLPALGREFLRFTQTPLAQAAIAGQGYVDQRFDTITMGEQGNRLVKAIANLGEDANTDDLKRLVEELGQAHRLTITFRFENGSANLDAPSRANVGYLARMLEGRLVPGTEVVFSGFSDGTGSPEANMKLSEKRARAVRDAAEKAIGGESAADIGYRFTVLGFGETMPISCDDSDWGRQINRRVEIWVR